MLSHINLNMTLMEFNSQKTVETWIESGCVTNVQDGRVRRQLVDEWKEQGTVCMDLGERSIALR